MMKILLHSSDSWGPLFVRIFLGAVVFPHGAQKLLGWFGGHGFSATMNFFTTQMNLHWIIAFLVIILESVGAAALVAGVGTRFIALSYVILALGMVFMAHAQNGFFMNWFGNQPGEGYEYFLLWIGMAVSLIFSGAGKYSVDRILVESAY